jgi:hypothetical protein
MHWVALAHETPVRMSPLLPAVGVVVSDQDFPFQVSARDLFGVESWLVKPTAMQLVALAHDTLMSVLAKARFALVATDQVTEAAWA